MEVIVGKLKKYGVIYNREATSLSKFVLLKSREAFRQNPPHRLPVGTPAFVYASILVRCIGFFPFQKNYSFPNPIDANVDLTPKIRNDCLMYYLDYSK